VQQTVFGGEEEEEEEEGGVQVCVRSLHNVLLACRVSPTWLARAARREPKQEKGKRVGAQLGGNLETENES